MAGDHRSYYSLINKLLQAGAGDAEGIVPIAYRILKPESRRSKSFNTDFGKAYVAGNIVEGQ